MSSVKDVQGASEWAAQLLGDREAEVRKRIGQAIRDRQERALTCQDVAGGSTRHAYGGARYPGFHESLMEEFARVDGNDVRFNDDIAFVNPDGFFKEIDLVCYRGALLWPFRFSDRDISAERAKLSGSRLVRELMGFAPPPPPREDLFGSWVPQSRSTDMRPRLAALPADTKLLLIPFSSNASGLLKAYWGVGTLIDDQGTIAWSDGPDPLPLPATPVRRGLALLPPQTHPTDLPSFDSGAQPVPELFSRPDVDEKNPGLSPQSEKQEHQPLTTEEENEN